MYSLGKNDKLWVKSLAVFLILLLGSGDIAYSLDVRSDQVSTTNLIPTERTGPIAFVEESQGGLTVKADRISIAGFLNSFKKRYEILYVALLMGEALAGQIEENDGVRGYVEEFLHKEAFESIDIEALKGDGDSYVAPYRIPETGQVIKLRFCIDPEMVDSSKPSVEIGNVIVVVEDYPGYDEDLWSGTFYFEDLKIDVTWDDLKEASHLGVFERIKAFVPTGEGLLDGETREELDEAAAGTGEDDRAGPAKKRAYLDRATIFQSAFLSLLYLFLSHPAETGLLYAWEYMVPAIIVSVVIHEFFHWLKIKTVKDKKNFYGKFHVGLSGLYFDLAADNDSEVDMIILSGMVASGTVSTIFSVLSLFGGNAFFIIMGIVNATFAFSGRDVDVLKRKADFAKAPVKILKKLKRAWSNVEGSKSLPSVVLLGGYFSSGKGVIARMLARYLRRNTDKDVYVVHGDNWLLSDRRRVRRIEEVYPYNAYELEKWKEMVKRASEGSPIFVPFYMSTFRMRLKASDKEFFIYQDKMVPFEEDGYKLLYADDLRQRPIKDFLPASKVKELIRRIEQVWADDHLQRRRILRHLKKRLNAKLGKYMINKNSELCLDYRTGDILERLPVKQNDILVMEFEQALMDDDVTELADVTAFVEASMIIRARYFLERRKKGLRYADLGPEETDAKFAELYTKETGLLPQKAKAGIVIENNQHLQDVVLEELNGSVNKKDRGVEKGEKERKRLRLYQKRDVSYNEIARASANKRNINDDFCRRRVAGFMRVLHAKALAAKKRNEKVIIGIDTSWIPDSQRPYLQGITSELKRLKKDDKYSNVEIVLENGVELAAEVEKKRDHLMSGGSPEGVSVPMSNVIFIGHWKVLGANEFKGFKHMGKRGDRGAFFVELALSRDFPHDGFVDLFPLLNVGINKAFTSDKRFYRVLLESEPFDLEEIERLYDIQLNVMTSA